MTVEPPVFEERRQTPDRRQVERRAEDHSRFLRTAAAAAIAICGGLVVVYLFFGAIGAVNFKDAAVATGVAIVLTAVWLAGYWFRHRTMDPRGISPMDRERRGF
jgi:protein-S-isoprenylcysteine O-methyltransferase Ste14